MTGVTEYLPNRPIRPDDLRECNKLYNRLYGTEVWQSGGWRVGSLGYIHETAGGTKPPDAYAVDGFQFTFGWQQDPNGPPEKKTCVAIDGYGKKLYGKAGWDERGMENFQPLVEVGPSTWTACHGAIQKLETTLKSRLAELKEQAKKEKLEQLLAENGVSPHENL